MAMTLEEFRATAARMREELAQGRAPAGVTACSDCSVPLQETVTGHRRYDDLQEKTHFVCSDCYFDALDEVLTAHPVKSTPVIR